MNIIEIKSDLLAQPLGIYSNGIRVDNPNSIIFLSGFVSRNSAGEIVGKGDIRVQTDTILKNMKIALQNVGADMRDVVKLTIYIRDMNDFKDIHEIRARYFSEPYPASSMLEVSRMVSEDSLIEIESIAVI